MEYIWPGGLQETEEGVWEWLQSTSLIRKIGICSEKMPEHVIEMGEDPNVFAYMELRK